MVFSFRNKKLKGEKVEVIPKGTVERLKKILPSLNERQQRNLLALEAKALGHGGIKIISEIAGVSCQRIIRGIKQLSEESLLQKDKIRKEGGGRKLITEKYINLKEDLRLLLEADTLGDPMSPLLWLSKSTRKLARELIKMGYNISHVTVKKLLNSIGYSLQANQKTKEGSKNPDRNAQFEHINEKAKSFIGEGNPVISIDTKKKELIGNFKNAGKEYAPKGMPKEVNVYDFPQELLKAIPYGIYDIIKNEGWVNVGITSDTSQFAVESIRRWWNGLGKSRYPSAKKIMITADGGGSNGSRTRLFKKELQQLANETGLSIYVCHFPPGTSKWNKIEHRMFSFISQNWRARPLLDLVTVVNLIASTTTKTGLKICCELDENIYETGIVVSDEEIHNLNITRDSFHGEWNYAIHPQK